MEKKVLNLVVAKKWFDMIASGEKNEEYRVIKAYWINRLVEAKSDASPGARSPSLAILLFPGVKKAAEGKDK